MPVPTSWFLYFVSCACCRKGAVTSIVHILFYWFIVGIIARAISEAQNINKG